MGELRVMENCIFIQFGQKCVPKIIYGVLSSLNNFKQIKVSVILCVNLALLSICVYFIYVRVSSRSLRSGRAPPVQAHRDANGSLEHNSGSFS